MYEIMLDLETLGTDPNSVIVTVGAIKFIRNKNIQEFKSVDKFYRRIDVKSCEQLGMTKDPATMRWWKKQPQQVQHEAFNHPDRYKLKDVLQEFSYWIGSADKVWANSPSFDCIILTQAYKKCGMRVPWEYWNTRDVRTILDIGGVNLRTDIPQSGDEHNAVWDCYRQIQAIQLAEKRIGYFTKNHIMSTRLDSLKYNEYET